MKARIELPEDFPDTAPARIELDGLDVAHAVRDLRLAASPGGVPVLTLDVMVFDTVVDGEMRVEIPEETRDLLAKLGWTPPKEDA